MHRRKLISFCLLIALIAIVINILDKNVDGLTIAFIGDSLMEGYGNDMHGFEYYFPKYLPNSKFINNSKSGSTISDNTGNYNIIMINQAKTLQGAPDIICLDGGANDIIDYGLGFLDNSLKKEIGIANMNISQMSDPNTVIGDFEEIIVELQTRFPKAKICYFQMFLIDDKTIDKITIDESKKPDMKQRRDLLYEQIKLICQKRNVYFIDVSDKMEGTELTYRQDDWIHLKAEGYQYLTPFLIKKLNNIV